MSIKSIIALLGVAIISSTFAGTVLIRLEGGGFNGTFTVTTNEVSCGRINWDGVPDINGEMSGGQYEITGQLVSNEVVLVERTMTAHEGIRSDITSKTMIPIKKLPWTGTISQTTATVYQVENVIENTNSPNQKLQPTVKTPVESGSEQGTAAEL